jgi:hypothetical protein
MSSRREGISSSEKVSPMRFQNEIDLNSPIADAARREIDGFTAQSPPNYQDAIGLFNSNIGSYSSPHT